MNQVRSGPVAVSIEAPPTTRSVRVSLVGDVVMGAEPALAEVIGELSRSQPDVVILDLTAVNFVCSTFANFVADVHRVVPDASLMLHNPSRMARLVLAITGLDTIRMGRDDATPLYIRIPRPY